jgi:hypothetical protein
MRSGILRKLPLLAAALGLGVLLAPQAYELQEGEETVEEIRRRIQEEEEEAKAEARRRQHEHDGYSCCSLFGDFFQALADSPSEPADDHHHRRDYPKEESRPFLYLLRGHPPPGYSRWGYLGLDVDGACLFQNRWTLGGRFSVNLQALHLHAFSQVLFDPTGLLFSYSFNGGLNIMARHLLLNLFVGAFGTDLTGALFDFGAEARIFLTARWVLELYSLNAVYYSLHFNFLYLALHYAGNKASLGAGLNLNNYAGVVLAGPALRLSFWL